MWSSRPAYPYGYGYGYSSRAQPSAMPQTNSAAAAEAGGSGSGSGWWWVVGLLVVVVVVVVVVVTINNNNNTDNAGDGSLEEQAPEPPTLVSAEWIPGTRTARVRFTPSTSSSGSGTSTSSTALTYWVTSDVGGLTASGSSSPITIGPLEPATAYRFLVVAKTTTTTNNNNISTPVTSNEVVTPALPSPVTNVRFRAVTSTRLEVGFDVPSTASSTSYVYEIYEGSVGAGLPLWKRSVTAPGTYAVDQELRPLTLYTVQVQSMNVFGASPWTSKTYTTPGLPGTPVDVVATMIPNTTNASVSFAVVDEYATAFRVVSDPGNLTTTSDATMDLVVGPLEHDTNYVFTVFAFNHVFTSLTGGRSNALNSTFQVSGLANVRLELASPTSVRVDVPMTGNPLNEGLLFELRATLVGSSGTVLVNPPTADRTFVMGGLTPGSTYTFQIRALLPPGIGPFSNTLPNQVTMPLSQVLPVSDVQVTRLSVDGSQGTFRVQVTPSPNDLASKYRLRVIEFGVEIVDLDIAPTNLTVQITMSVFPSNTYTFRVTAVNQAMESTPVDRTYTHE